MEKYLITVSEPKLSAISENVFTTEKIKSEGNKTQYKITHVNNIININIKNIFQGTLSIIVIDDKNNALGYADEKGDAYDLGTAEIELLDK